MNIYQHFRPEEREFIDQVLQWKSYVETKYAPKLTDFLDPREQHILKMLIGDQGDVKYQLFGGYPEVERSRALLLPDYLSVTQDDFQITLFEIDYPSKFVTIEHPQVLGSLMSLGLKRGKFGDILFKEDRIQFFVANEVKDYIQNNLQSIGRASIKLKAIELGNAISSQELWGENELTVSSLRLDTVISGIHHLSRQKSQMFIQQGIVKVNWTLIENSSFECAEGDLISVRGHGRAKIMSIDGKTKKEKWRINVGKQK
ncbi:YlmH family RNA-binding protein [Neobacillus ginsengisoli]|uniref:RNA-binding protein YlmH n=1 Tax=Neobacillus ginsengisoli TaxID=904295 RepID=A0ABT9XSH6_9BACI|nr:RNA-binding protein [Neobacillus ginsengisoli]MDQ0198517.1 RNA-binding protein YlmH [Neobacillus ginsengisoli]